MIGEDKTHLHRHKMRFDDGVNKMMKNGGNGECLGGKRDRVR